MVPCRDKHERGLLSRQCCTQQVQQRGWLVLCPVWGSELCVEPSLKMVLQGIFSVEGICSVVIMWMSQGAMLFAF